MSILLFTYISPTNLSCIQLQSTRFLNFFKGRWLREGRWNWRPVHLRTEVQGRELQHQARLTRAPQHGQLWTGQWRFHLYSLLLHALPKREYPSSPLQTIGKLGEGQSVQKDPVKYQYVALGVCQLIETEGWGWWLYSYVRVFTIYSKTSIPTRSRDGLELRWLAWIVVCLKKGRGSFLIFQMLQFQKKNILFYFLR